MSNITKNLKKLAAAIENDHRELDLLALFQREDHTDWELVLSAPWALENIWDAIGYVGTKGEKLLGIDAGLRVTSTVILDKAVDELRSRFPGPGEYHSFVLNGVPVARAIIVRLSSPRTRKKRLRAARVA